MTPINPIAAATSAPGVLAQTALAASQGAPAPSFGDMIMHGLHDVEGKVNTATDLVRAFAVDDSVPVHEVTIALAQARSSLDLTLQIRSRLVDGYRELMNMQL